jgi:bacillithiol system protein YtxJ
MRRVRVFEPDRTVPVHPSRNFDSEVGTLDTLVCNPPHRAGFYALLDLMPVELSKVLAFPELSSTHEFESLARRELSIIFKHSHTCPISLFAHREVARFRESRPDTPVYLISVKRQRDISRHVAEYTGVQHESPQVVVISRGDVLATASHDEITAEWIASAVASHPAAK